MRKLGRVVRAIVLNLIAVVGALVLLGIILFGLAQTRFGERLIRRELVGAVNQSIEGSIGVDELKFGGNRIALEGVTIWTPEHERVGHIRRVEVSLRLRALLHRTVQIERIAVEQPELSLQQQEGGLNLARALEARHPTPPSKPARVRIALDELALDEGRIDYRGAAGARSIHGRVVDLTIRARGVLDVSEQSADGALEVRGAAERPVAAPLQLSAAGKIAGRPAERQGGGSLSASAGRSVLEAHATLEGETMHARLDRFEVAPELIRAFVPGYTAATPLTVTGAATAMADVVAGRASLHAGPGTLELHGRADSRQPSFAVRVEGRHVDLASMLPDRPRSDLDITLDAAGSGRSWSELDGHLALDVPAGRVGDQTVGPVYVHARSQRAGARRLDATARLPGFQASARGRGDVRRVRSSGDLAVSDAALLGRTLAALLGRPLPPAAGSLAVRFSADGRPGRLRSARLEASSPMLAVGTTRLRDLELSADSDERTLRSQVHMAGPLALVASLAGEWGRGHRTLELKQMRVRYPQAEWLLAGPARIVAKDGRLAVEHFRLRAAPSQEIAIDASKTGSAIAGDLVVSALRLDSLPVPAGRRPALTGRFDARIHAAGTTDTPRADANIWLRRAVVGGYTRVNATVAAHVAEQRATGTFSARSAQGWAEGRFALPARWPPPDDAPISVDATAGVPDLTRVPALAAREPGLEGEVRMRMAVRGTAARPRADMNVDAEHLAVTARRGEAETPEVNMHLRAGYAGDAATVRLRGRSSNGGQLSGDARVRTRVSLVRPIPAQSLRHAPVSAHLVANDFSMSPLAVAADRIAAVGGWLEGEVHVAGTVARPAVKGTLSWRHGRVVVRREAIRPAEGRTAQPNQAAPAK